MVADPQTGHGPLPDQETARLKEFASFRLDTVNECLWRDGAQITLPPRPFLVLRYLVDNPGRLITHDELLDALWPETYVQPQVLRTYMLELRKLLGDHAGQPQFIQTVPKRGYRFVAPVSKGNASANANGSESSKRNFVGRDEELKTLEAQVELSRTGERRAIFITGEPGIGKTALVNAFSDRLDGSFCVLRGQCVEGFGEKEEYYPLIEALGQLSASPQRQAACRLVAEAAPAWLPSSTRSADHLPVAPVQERVAGNLCAALEQLAASQPLLLILEDLHWSDHSTLNLVSALVRRRTPARLMLLATCSSSHGESDRPLRALRQHLLMRQLCTEVQLPPLTKTATRELLSSSLDCEALPHGLTGFVHQNSEGNPMFALAIVEHLIDRRFLVSEGGDTPQWKLAASFEEIETEVPDQLAQMIELQIEALTAEEQRILEAGSVAGIAFPSWAVAAALETDESAIEETCAAMTRRLHFVERGGQDELPGGRRSEFLVFVHSLYREVLYRRQPAARRALSHRRIAERLSEIFAGGPWAVSREIALHYEAAGEWDRAVAVLRSAARRARDNHAPHEAARLLEDALRLAANLADKPALLRELREELMNARHHPGAGKLRLVSRKS